MIKIPRMTKRTVHELPEDVAQKLKLIGLKVKERRKQIEKNYVLFSEKNQLNSMTVWRIENGENCNIASLIEVLDALEVSLEEFFKGI